MFRVPLWRFADQFVYFERAIALDLIQVFEIFTLPIESFQLTKLEIFIKQVDLRFSEDFSAEGAL